jgi:two-component system sensor histidine kinase AlgZ
MALWLQWREAAARRPTPRARLAELQSRIRPHFLFNTLNTAVSRWCAPTRRAPRACWKTWPSCFASRLADDSGSGSVTLASELELARRYLAIEQLRFGERLRLDWQLDAADRRARLPPLVLQPLLENAVRHGSSRWRRAARCACARGRRLGRAEITSRQHCRRKARPGPGTGWHCQCARAPAACCTTSTRSSKSERATARYRVRIVVPLGRMNAPPCAY